MAKPVIMSVDDDPEVLGAIDRDLRQHYRNSYRIIKVASGAEALDTATQLKQRGTPIALFLVDQRMPEMTGTELLSEVMKLHPESRKVLLTAYADTEAAIACINEVGLDHYLLKPWDPPEQRLYPVLDDLLSDWSANVQRPYEGIRVAGARWSLQSFAVKDFLSRNHIPYQWIDVERDASLRESLNSVGDGVAKLPVVLFPDGEYLVAPSNSELARKVGLQTEARLPFYDLIIVGAGPAGLASAVYGASEGLHTLLIEQKAPGGQAGSSSQIENYLGFPSGVSGADLARRAATQARRFGTEILTQEVISLKRQDPYRVVGLANGTEVSSKAVVWATGVSVRKLDVPGVEKLLGAGVYYGAAMTEAATYRDQDVCVVGGANSAGQGALFFSRYARRVTMLVRADSLSRSMSQYLIDRINATQNIEVLTGVEVKGARGGDHLEQVALCNIENAQEREITVAAMFIFIGAAPRTEILQHVVELDDKGYVLTGPDLPREKGRPRGWTLQRDPHLFETNVPGIFAAGDVRSGSGKRVAAAVGEGSATVSMVHRYLETV